MKCVLQDWVLELPMMQQTVLLTAIRGPDGLAKYHPSKYLLRWYRRCILKSSLDGLVLDNPWDERGGSFTGPSVKLGPDSPELEKEEAWGRMEKLVDSYNGHLDEVPHHFGMHFMHGTEILGYKHPQYKYWWFGVYLRLVNDIHLHIETKEELDRRLGDTYEGWMERNDKATMT